MSRCVTSCKTDFNIAVATFPLATILTSERTASEAKRTDHRKRYLRCSSRGIKTVIDFQGEASFIFHICFFFMARHHFVTFCVQSKTSSLWPKNQAVIRYMSYGVSGTKQGTCNLRELLILVWDILCSFAPGKAFKSPALRNIASPLILKTLSCTITVPWITQSCLDAHRASKSTHKWRST